METLKRMAKDIAAITTFAAAVVTGAFLIIVTPGAIAAAFGATTGLPTWALVIGRLVCAAIAALAAYTWFESAKKRAAKRNN